MQKINWARMILGGLAAGVLLFVLEGLGGMIWAEDWKAALERIGVSMEFGPASIFLSVALSLCFGLFAVWLYAAIRPRFGPGPATAVKAGLGAWFGGHFLTILSYGSIGIFPARLLVFWAGYGLVELILATLAGAWIYRETEQAQN
jgi:hypothetical protein